MRPGYEEAAIAEYGNTSSRLRVAPRQSTRCRWMMMMMMMHHGGESCHVSDYFYSVLADERRRANVRLVLSPADQSSR